jgi:transposase
LLFKAETVYHLKPLEKYEILFSFLDTSSLKRLYPVTGRPPVGYEVLLKALIYKNMKNISYFSDLVRVLRDYPDLALVFGFHPLKLPQVENFSAFLADTDNGILQEVRNALVGKLIQIGEIRGRYLAFDSTNIPVKVKENNLKTSLRDRFRKNRRPKGDPQSRLGVMIHFPKPFQKKIRYFWGYRNFVLCDAWSELPLVEETRPANVVDSKIILPQLSQAKDQLGLEIGAVIANSAKVLSFIIRDLKAKPYIARNLRREKIFLSLEAVTVYVWLALRCSIGVNIGKEKGPESSLSVRLSILRSSERNTPTVPGCIHSLSRELVVLPTGRWWMKISASKLPMGVESSRKSITCAVARKGFSPGYWNWPCKIRVSGGYRLSPITLLLPISQFYWLP